MTPNERITELIKHNPKYTQKDLASSIGVAASTMNNWLKLGRSIPAEMIIPISEFFDISCEYLLTGDDKGATPSSQDDSDWLMLIHKLPIESRYELKGYAKRMLAEAATAPDEEIHYTNGVPSTAADAAKLAKQSKEQNSNTKTQAV